MNTRLFVIALVIPVLLIWLISRRARWHPTHPLMLAALGVGGMLCAWLALVLNLLIEKYTQLWQGAENIWLWGGFWVAGVGLNEELAKMLVLLVMLYPLRSFQSVSQGILGAATVSAGFAATENLIYLERFGPPVLFLRSLLTVPAHVLFSVPMGALLARAGLANNTYHIYAWMLGGLFCAALLHGLYDLLISWPGGTLVILAYMQIALMGLILLWFLHSRAFRGQLPHKAA